MHRNRGGCAPANVWRPATTTISWARFMGGLHTSSATTIMICSLLLTRFCAGELLHRLVCDWFITFNMRGSKIPFDFRTTTPSVGRRCLQRYENSQGEYCYWKCLVSVHWTSDILLDWLLQLKGQCFTTKSSILVRTHLIPIDTRILLRTMSLTKTPDRSHLALEEGMQHIVVSGLRYINVTFAIEFAPECILPMRQFGQRWPSRLLRATWFSSKTAYSAAP